MAQPRGSVTAGIGATSAAIGSTVTVSAATGVTAKIASLPIVAKVMTSITAATIVIGIPTAIISSSENNTDPSPIPFVSTMPTAVTNSMPDAPPSVAPTLDPAVEAISSYEEFLALSQTDSGLKINYYTHIDLNGDGVNLDFTKEWSILEPTEDGNGQLITIYVFKETGKAHCAAGYYLSSASTTYEGTYEVSYDHVTKRLEQDGAQFKKFI